MNKIFKMYCLSLNPNHLQKITDLNYIPVGLGNKNFSENWFSDNLGNNIKYKNSMYGEYTFHYSLWKNQLLEDNKWFGFCTYRRFWSNSLTIKNIKNFENKILKEIPKEWENYEVILAEPIMINKTKLSKILKHGKKILFKNPFIFFNSKNITIKTHFDMYHGYGNLDKAINLLDDKNRDEFRNFVNTNNSFNPYNMFVCRSKEILLNYYESIFPWLESCESIFGLNIENEYGKKRIYGFLAERYLSFWFNKYYKTLNWPIIFNDIT